MQRLKRPLPLALIAIGLTAGTGVPVAMREQGYWADRPATEVVLRSRFTPADARRLRPGQYRWAPYPGDPAPIHVAIDLAGQRAYVFQANALIGIASVSTGRRGHGTPTGAYPILEKARWHRSNLYSDAPMPYMQRLTWGGIALHAGYNPGHPASHGCIRLPAGFARVLFHATRTGGMVVVTRGNPMAPPPEIAAPPVEMASAAPLPTPPDTTARPIRQVAMSSTEQSVALMSGTML